MGSTTVTSFQHFHWSIVGTSGGSVHNTLGQWAVGPFSPRFFGAQGVDEFLVVRLRHCHHLQEQGDAGEGTDAAFENHGGFFFKQNESGRISTQFVYVYVVSV